MDSNQDELVAQFSGITGASPNGARTALEQANWNLQEAVGLYYAAQESDGEDEEPQAAAAPSQPQPAPSQPAAASSSSSARKPPNQSRMKTLRDLQGSVDDDDDDNDERDRDLFAGGEKSGLAVQSPGNTPQDHFRNIMNQARQNAPRGGDGDDDHEATPARPSAFSGPAQTLGGDDAPSRTIADPNARPAGAARTGRDLPKITRTMHLWADGVSIDDGPLFRFDDPANAQMMAQINRGHAPLSLLDVQPDQEVDLTLDPHRDENYVQPKQKYKPFSGSGNRLGSPTPGPSSSTAFSAPAPAAAAAASSSSSSAPTNSVDESAPTITLQIRLGDGTRLQSRFNTTQTIGDVYNFVSRAASTNRAYALMTTFPSKELSDKSQVLGDIGDFKRGGVVVQKWT